MDAFDWIAGVYMTALAMAKCMDSKELTRSALIFTQLGTTLATLAALQELDETSIEKNDTDSSAL